jgi:hypothetical protein
MPKMPINPVPNDPRQKYPARFAQDFARKKLRGQIRVGADQVRRLTVEHTALFRETVSDRGDHHAAERACRSRRSPEVWPFFWAAPKKLNVASPKSNASQSIGARDEPENADQPRG